MTVSVSNQIYTIRKIKFQKLCLEFLIVSPSTNSPHIIIFHTKQKDSILDQTQNQTKTNRAELTISLKRQIPHNMMQKISV